MKKRNIVLILSGFCFYFIITSYSGGPGNNGYDCTGAESGLGNPTGCTGAGCHSSSATTGIGVVLELDSAGVPTTHYKGGMNYTVKIKGMNNTTNSLSKFGFQMGSITGSSAMTTPTNAGTWSATCPTGTHYAAPQSGNFVVGVVEHTMALSPSTGTGGQGTTYTKSFSWTAPVAGTGTISFWAALMGVNGNGSADAGDLWNTTHAVINEWTSTTAVTEVLQSQFNVNVFPNPVSDHINLTYILDTKSNVSVKLIDIKGQKIADLLNEVQPSGTQSITKRLPEGLGKGIYFLEANFNNDQVVKKILVE